MSPIQVRKSPIHGRGLFAAQPFKTGEVVGHYRSRKTRQTAEENPYVIEVYDDEDNLVEHRIGLNEFRYINHSTDPNLEMHDDDLKFVAVKDIEEGDELTWFYGPEFEATMLEG